jgi:8-oxo-dGTP diphosphatase
MVVAVALAMLHRDNHWLLQLRDDMDGIVAPGHWGLFGGHLEPSETPEQALRRELIEEICWQAAELQEWFTHTNSDRAAHFFRGPLTVTLDQLQLLEGQDLTLVSIQELLSGAVWSPRLRERRPLAPSLQLALQRLVAEQGQEC